MAVCGTCLRFRPRGVKHHFMLQVSQGLPPQKKQIKQINKWNKEIHPYRQPYCGKMHCFMLISDRGFPAYRTKRWRDSEAMCMPVLYCTMNWKHSSFLKVLHDLYSLLHGWRDVRSVQTWAENQRPCTRAPLTAVRMKRSTSPTSCNISSKSATLQMSSCHPCDAF